MLFDSAEVEEYRVDGGDVLICEGGGGIARSAVWDGQIPGIMFQKALRCVRPLLCLNGFRSAEIRNFSIDSLPACVHAHNETAVPPGEPPLA